MAYNVPSYDEDKFSFGPAILYVQAIPATGVSTIAEATLDTLTVGAVRSGGTFSVTRTRLEINQGSPATLIHQFVTQETANANFNGIEWDLNTVRLALGAGETTGSANDLTLGFGGDMNMIQCAVKVRHVMPSGATITIRMWKAQGSGEMTITFGDDLHEIPYSFDALEAGSFGWDGVTLAEKNRLFNISYDE